MPRVKLHLNPPAPDAAGEAAKSSPTADRPGPEPLVYDTADLAFVLRTSEATLHRLRAAGKLPRPLRLGGQLRWPAEEIHAWVRAGMPDVKTWEVLRANL